MALETGLLWVRDQGPALWRHAAAIQKPREQSPCSSRLTCVVICGNLFNCMRWVTVWFSRRKVALWSCALIGFCFGCGVKESDRNPQAGLTVDDPIYPVLSEDAPLADQLDEASAHIERDLLEEQEKFYRKRFDEIRGFYTDPDGGFLISNESFSRLMDLMSLAEPVRLKVTPQRLKLVVPPPESGAYQEPVSGEVLMLSGTVSAEAEYSPQVPVASVGLRALYEYRVEAGDLQSRMRTQSLFRTIRYAKGERGVWKRVGIEESPVNVVQ